MGRRRSEITTMLDNIELLDPEKEQIIANLLENKNEIKELIETSLTEKEIEAISAIK